MPNQGRVYVQLSNYVTPRKVRGMFTVGMAERKTKLVEGEIYHIYNRGNFRHEIFHDEQDYTRFKKILYLSNGTKKFKYKDLLKYDKNIFNVEKGDEIVSVLCYVLMPNHFHLLLIAKPIAMHKNQGVNKHLDNNISIYMKRVTSAYSMYYNRKYKKTGTLFESKFKSEHVNDNNYFKYLFSYIHLNPVKLVQSNWKEEGIKNFEEVNTFLHRYKHSSFKEYFKTEILPTGENKIIRPEEFFYRIEQGVDLQKEIFDWLKFETIN
jgi:REP element-mobilizing transposase RayT